MRREEIFEEIVKERARQDKKWGVQNRSDDEWNTRLCEETGEIAKAIIEHDDELENEIIHTIAVGVVWLECRERAAEWAEGEEYDHV